LFQTRGGAYPALDAIDQAKTDYVQTLLADSEPDALLRFKRATQAFLFSDGRQHIDWTTRDKMWRDLPTPEGRIHVTMNYMRPILRSRMQRMVSAELLWRTIPSGNDYESRDRAEVATNLLDGRGAYAERDGETRLALRLAV